MSNVSILDGIPISIAGSRNRCPIPEAAHLLHDLVVHQMRDLSLIATGVPDSSANYTRQQKRHVPVAPAHQSPNVPPYWEHILREFVFKTISPPPPGNNGLYKRLLYAPLYGGPFPIVPNDVGSVVLSRGNVYYLPNGRWLLCQEGCIDCQPCIEHTHPTVKWVLRRIKRLPLHGPTRHDLQLTIIPQIDGSYHMSNLWPRSYIYVTTQGEEAAYSSDRHGYDVVGSFEDNFSELQRKNNSFWKFEEQSNATTARQPFESDSGQNVNATVAPAREHTTEQTTSKNTGKSNPRVKSPDGRNANGTMVPDVFTENARNKLKQLLPKLILGTDQLGQKHLVHVVPADGSNNANVTGSVLLNPHQYHNKTAYQRMLRRIYDSLSSNKRSIESFLEPLTQTGKMSQPIEEHQQQETRNGLAGLGQLDRFHRGYNERIGNGSSTYKHWPLVLNLGRQQKTSNDDTNTDRLVSNTISINRTAGNSNDLHSDQNSNAGKNISDRLNLKSATRNYYGGNAFFNSSTKINDALHNSQEHKFGPRKFKIVVTTESTTKSANKIDTITNDSKSVVNKSKQLNHGVMLNNS
ncbi:uncharacterized protein LOC143342816 [Colletes latitarsis]|uniref:uncharacterized protein LOC143342816 n=1 Tax=Colletes latitarsis TaxID=2605962 RepID=UPI004034FF4F